MILGRGRALAGGVCGAAVLGSIYGSIWLGAGTKWTLKKELDTNLGLLKPREVKAELCGFNQIHRDSNHYF